MNRELVERARQGDHEAFEALATAVVNRLYGLARLILRDTELAEDATQEALFRAWRDLPSLRDPGKWDAWLRRLLVHAAIDEARRRRRFEANVRVLGQEPSTGDGPAAIVDRDPVWTAIRQLTVEQRAVVTLRFDLDLSVPEIAETLGLPLGTAKSRLHYAIEALRAALEADARATTREATA